MLTVHTEAQTRPELLAWYLEAGGYQYIEASEFSVEMLGDGSLIVDSLDSHPNWLELAQMLAADKCQHIAFARQFPTGMEGVVYKSEMSHIQIDWFAGRVWVKGMETTDWGGFLQLNLLLLMAYKKRLTRDEVFAAIWPRLEVKEATNVYHVTKGKICIITGTGDDLIDYANFFYTLNANLVKSDLDTFWALVEAAYSALEMLPEQSEKVTADDVLESKLKVLAAFSAAIDFVPNKNASIFTHLGEQMPKWMCKLQEELRETYLAMLRYVADASFELGSDKAAHYNSLLWGIIRDTIHPQDAVNLKLRLEKLGIIID